MGKSGGVVLKTKAREREQIENWRTRATHRVSAAIMPKVLQCFSVISSQASILGA